MRRKKRKPVALGHGGLSWQGWSFGPYGQARECRLIDPNGTTYTAGDILEGARAPVELDYLRHQVRTLAAQRDGAAVHFTLEEILALHAAAAILARVLPAATRRVRRETAAMSVTGRRPSARPASSTPPESLF